MASRLASQVDADYINIDNGTLGCEGNHKHVWRHLANSADDWCIVLEDDAQPVQRFRKQAQTALATTPCDIVSFYLGHPRHWHWYPDQMERLTAAGTLADEQQACWIRSKDIIHGVALAIRTELVAGMLEHITGSTLPIDYAIRQWVRDTGRTTAFTWPSLIEHHDGPTLVKHHDRKPRPTPRKAWRVGERTHWTTEAVTM